MVKGRIVSVGAGMDWRKHLTLEGVEAISTVQKAFYFGELRGIENSFPGRHVPWHDLSKYAVYGEPRIESYRRVVAHILDEVANCGSVAWVTQGNPYILDGATAMLRERCRDGSIEFRVVPGLSTMDALLAYLDVDMLAGLQILEANSIWLRRMTLNTALPTIILQFARQSTHLQVLDYAISASGLENVAGILVEAYGGDQQATLVTAPTHLRAEPDIMTLRLGNLVSAAPHINPWSSLFIPPKNAPIVDADRLKRMYDPMLLAENFETPLERILREGISEVGATSSK